MVLRDVLREEVENIQMRWVGGLQVKETATPMKCVGFSCHFLSAVIYVIKTMTNEVHIFYLISSCAIFCGIMPAIVKLAIIIVGDNIMSGTRRFYRSQS